VELMAFAFGFRRKNNVGVKALSGEDSSRGVAHHGPRLRCLAVGGSGGVFRDGKSGR